MKHEVEKETKGAWIVHHGQKISLDANGAAEFAALDEAAKASNLLCKLGESDQVTLSSDEVKVVAQVSRLNPRLEVPALLGKLQERRLVELGADGSVTVLGVTTRGALKHASDIFDDAEPSQYEIASIDLAEKISEAPCSRSRMAEYIGDIHKMPKADTDDFLNRSEQIGFVDGEGQGTERLLFNGNLFKRDTVEKTTKVLNSLSSAEQVKVVELNDMLAKHGCVNSINGEKILGSQLFEKLKAAALYDLNTVSNETGEHVFITAPAAFHKFVNPMIDDCFDMAKALVAALSYGMNSRSTTEGQIWGVELLLRKLIRGSAVGPAPAIGKDYRVLEQNRVVKIIHSGYNKFSMKLLKKEVGEMALQVLSTGQSNQNVLKELPGASMTGYMGPEASRTQVRRKQSGTSRKMTQDVISVLREGRSF